MQASNASLTKSSAINTIIQNLSHITDKVEQEEQESLLQLDKVVLKYISSRNKSIYNKNAASISAPQNKIQSNQHLDLLTLKGLETIHSESQLNILQLQNKIVEFYKNRELIQQHNLRFVKDSAQIKQSNIIIELCKQMMAQLAKYKDIQDFYSRLVDFRKKTSTSHSHGELLDELDAYFIKMSNFMSDEQDVGPESDQQKSQSKSLSQTKQRQYQDDGYEIPCQKQATLKNRLKSGQSSLLQGLIQ